MSLKRNFTNFPATATLSAAIGSTDTTISVSGDVNWPTPPFTVTVDMEIMLVTGGGSGSYTVERGHDGTPAASHSAGATVVPQVTAETLTRSSQAPNRIVESPLLPILGYESPSGAYESVHAHPDLLFYWDANHYLKGAIGNQNSIMYPAFGQAGTFTRPTSAFYFDSQGNFKEATANTPVWSKAPSGLVLPRFSPSHKNEVTDNLDASTGSVNPTRLILQNPTNYGAFTLYERIQTTEANVHYHNWLMSSLPVSGDVICMAGLIKPINTAPYAKIGFAYGGTWTGYAEIPYDGSEPTLPTGNSYVTPLYASLEALPNGYYWVQFAIYVNDASTIGYARHDWLCMDETGMYTVTGDGTTVRDIVGAFTVCKNMLHIPAPIPTGGSAVTAGQDLLTFPFTEPLPPEGITVLVDMERDVAINPSLTGWQAGVFANRGSSNAIDLYWNVGTSQFVFKGASGGIGRYAIIPNDPNTRRRAVARWHPDGTMELFDSSDPTTPVTTQTLAYPSGAVVDGQAISILSQALYPLYVREVAFCKGIIDPTKLL